MGKSKKRRGRGGQQRRRHQPDEKKTNRKKLIGMVLAALTAVGAGTWTLLAGALGPNVPLNPILDKIASWSPALDIKSSFVIGSPLAFTSATVAEKFVSDFNQGTASFADAVTAGGIPVAQQTNAILQIKGNRYQSVRLTNIRVDFEGKKDSPIANSIVCIPGGRGAAGDYEVALFDMDSEAPTPMFVQPDGKPTNEQYFRKRRVTLNRGEEIGFILQFKSDHHHLKFRVTVDFEYGSTNNEVKGSIGLQDNNRPFEFTSRPLGATSIGQTTSNSSSGYANVWGPTLDGRQIRPIRLSRGPYPEAPVSATC